MDRYQDPEQVIAVLNRRRHMKMWAAVVAVVLAFSTLLAASAAMYSEDPKAKVGLPASE
jgi:hypothetical protein